jgi:primosomal protein N'
MRIKVCSTWVLAASMLVSSTPAIASQHVASPSALRQAIVDQKAERAANHAAVKAVLDRQATRELAAQLGLDLTRADRALANMSSEQLAQLAATARTVNVDLAGGASVVVISTTTLLLILILIVLIAN